MLHWDRGGWAASAASASLPAGSEWGEVGAAKASPNGDGVNAEQAAPGGHACSGWMRTKGRMALGVRHTSPGTTGPAAGVVIGPAPAGWVPDGILS